MTGPSVPVDGPVVHDWVRHLLDTVDDCLDLIDAFAANPAITDDTAAALGRTAATTAHIRDAAETIVLAAAATEPDR